VAFPALTTERGGDSPPPPAAFHPQRLPERHPPRRCDWTVERVGGGLPAGRRLCPFFRLALTTPDYRAVMTLFERLRAGRAIPEPVGHAVVGWNAFRAALVTFWWKDQAGGAGITWTQTTFSYSLLTVPADNQVVLTLYQVTGGGHSITRTRFAFHGWVFYHARTERRRQLFANVILLLPPSTNATAFSFMVAYNVSMNCFTIHAVFAAMPFLFHSL